MKVLGLTILIAATALGGTAFGGNLDQARRYERLMQQASALRQEADQLRSDAAAKGNVESARGRAKALDQKADALETRARKAEPADWPPAE